MNRVTELFGIKYPIIQAGMIWASGWRLASAVSNAGGLGLIGAGSMYPDVLREHIQKCKAATNKPFGVNVPLLYPAINELIEIIIEEKVSIVFTSAGNPKTWTSTLKKEGIIVVHVVSSSKFAQKAEEAGCDAVKLEGGVEIIDGIKRILTAGIPVMGHLGLTPQSIYKFGTYTVRAKEDAEAEALKQDALLLEKAGCFAIVLEKVPAKLAQEVAQSLTIPVIGIGAGNAIDGQVLVTHDMLGMTHEFNPRFLRRYLDMYKEMTTAFKSYSADVKSGDFPNDTEQY